LNWIKLFPSASVARQRLELNKPQLLIVNGIRICMVLRDNQLWAVQDRCTHNGESLSKGTVNYLGDVICPWHGYRFDLRTGREANEQARDLITYPVKEEEEGVFIGM